MNILSKKDKLELVLELCEEHNVTAYEIGKNTVLTDAGVHKILTGESKKPHENTLNIILDYIENKIVGTDITSKNPLQDALNEEGAIYEIKNHIPFYDDVVIAGNNFNADMTARTTANKTIDIGDMLRDSKAAMRVYGSSMAPNYPSGCVIGLRLVEDGVIEWGKVYVIETTDNRYIKRIYNNEKGLYCYSDNTQTFSEGVRKGKSYFEPFIIPTKEIIRIHRVIGIIKRNENTSII